MAAIKMFLPILIVPAVLCSVSALNFTCLDTLTDLSNSGWTKSSTIHYYPSEFPDLGLTANGIFGTNTANVGTVSTFTRHAEPTGFSAVYLRYYAHVYNSESASRFYGNPATGQGDLETGTDLMWKETCIQFDPSSAYPYREVGAVLYSIRSYLLIDKMIYVSHTDPFPCNRTFFTEIRDLCPTDPYTESTTTFEVSTSTTTVPAPGNPQDILEWIDVDLDINRSQWRSDSSLQYASTSDDLPPSFGNKLEGHGIFYFRGTENVLTEAMSRDAHAGRDGDAYLIIRYYVHDYSGNNKRGFFVFPAKNDALGQHFLNTTSDYQWKEETIPIETSATFPTEIGMHATSSNDYLIIDRLIFVNRPRD